MMKKVLSTGGSFTDNGKTYVVNGHRFNCDNLLDIATSKAFKPTFMPDALEICKKITTTVKDQNGQLCNLCYGCAYQPIGDIGLCYDTKVDWKELVERLHDEYEDPSELNEDTIQSAFKLIDDDNFSPCTRLAILQNMYSFVGEIITPAQNFKL